MSQRIDNLYRLVTVPQFYSALQSILGATRARVRFADEIVQASSGMRVLDVGCGPGGMVPYLPSVDYVGFDLNEKHIADARAAFAGRGQFYVGDVSQFGASALGQFDRIIMSGILHHLTDAQCRKLLLSLGDSLKPGGRIVTLDATWVPRQRAIARALKKLDSGLNIRTPERYAGLVGELPYTVETRLYHDLLRVPYDHFCMTLTRPA